MRNKILLSAILVSTFAFSQEKVNKEELQKIEITNAAKYQQDKARAAQLLKEHKLPEESGFQGFENGTPVIYSVNSMTQIKSMDTDFIHDGTVTGAAVTGDGMTVYIWDGGKVRTTHTEFDDRAINVETTGTNSAHATGVGGVIVSRGAKESAKGIAPDALLKALNFTSGSTTAEMSNQSALDENQDYMISNHSYGSLTGWSFNSSNGSWYWYGYPHLSETESALFGMYTNTDAAYDNIAFNAPQHSIFKSSGNNRGEGPGEIVTHYAFAPNGSWQQFSGVERPDDCIANGGYDCLTFSGSMGKNIILVGAVRPIPGNQRYDHPNDVRMTSFSGFGPTDDGRIKPDLVAIGQAVDAPTNNSDNAYTNWNGTSFSTPAAAGVGVLLQQIKNEFDGGYLRSDMMKALLINTANESGTDLGPDYRFGYGLINSMKAAETIINSNNDSYTSIVTLENNGEYEITFKALGDEPIKATIAWLDPAGTPSPVVLLNDRTPMLVNDLDFRITEGGTTYFPWKLDPENPAEAATQEDNTVDNVEQVFIENPTAGAEYTFKVTHKGDLVNGQQVFALVINGVESNLGVNEVNLEEKISIYPNPVKDVLNIQWNKDLNNVQIRIFDAMGNVVHFNKLNSFNSNESINVNHLPTGVYLVHIKSDEGTITKKIIKK